MIAGETNISTVFLFQYGEVVFLFCNYRCDFTLLHSFFITKRVFNWVLVVNDGFGVLRPVIG